MNHFHPFPECGGPRGVEGWVAKLRTRGRGGESVKEGRALWVPVRGGASARPEFSDLVALTSPGWGEVGTTVLFLLSPDQSGPEAGEGPLAEPAA